MINKIKKIIKNSFFYDIILYFRNRKKYSRWVEKKKPNPPPDIVKQNIVRKHARQYDINTFIETGTYLGDMIWAMRSMFLKIYSIELDELLFTKAKKRFSKFQHINILKGDSGVVLKEILDDIKVPCIFWLDGHYSGGITAKGELETPILKELKVIMSHHVKSHIILIDDARCFIGKNDYPALEELKKIVIYHFPDHLFKVKNDIIRIY